MILIKAITIKRIISSVVLIAFLLAGILLFAFWIRPVDAEGQMIWIRPSGAVYPSTAPIHSWDNITYFFTDNITESTNIDKVIIERSNIIVDGQGFTLKNTASLGRGFYVPPDVGNVTIRDININGWIEGIYIRQTSKVTVTDNNITNSRHGVLIWKSSGCNIVKNNISTASLNCISIADSSSNVVLDNYLSDYLFEGIGLGTEYSGTVSDNIVANNSIEREGSDPYNSKGVYLTKYSHNTSVFGNSIRSNSHGIFIGSSNNAVSQNDLVNNHYGISIRQDGALASNNVVSDNNISSSPDYGIYVESSSNNSIIENNIANASVGINFCKSSDNTVLGNHIRKSGDIGIWLVNSSDNKIEESYITESTDDAIRLDNCTDISMAQNTVVDNAYGVLLYRSQMCRLRENNMTGNMHNFGVMGLGILDFIQDIDLSNLVDGRPIFYWINKRNMSAPSNAGYVALVNCTEMTVKNLNLTRNRQGILMAFTDNSLITQNNLANSGYGIYLHMSSRSQIVQNSLTSNSNGVTLYGSSNNTMIQNVVTGNYRGIDVSESSDNNTVAENCVANNRERGINLLDSSHNNVTGNKVMLNIEEGIVLGRSLYNWIENNIIDRNDCGLAICDSSNNTEVIRNEITSNLHYGIYLRWSSNSIIHHNNFIDNARPVYLDRDECPNAWDDGYPSGGNYWSDYTGADLYYGPYQNETGNDSIGDTPYEIDPSNRDHYPLMSLYNPIPWDVTGPTMWVPDRKCDIRDISIVAIRFGCNVGNPKYDRRADITGSTYLSPDLKIDIRDIALVAKHFGETYP